MSNIVPMIGGKETPTFENVLENYREAAKPQRKRREEVKDGYKVAQETMKALERSRGR